MSVAEAVRDGMLRLVRGQKANKKGIQTHCGLQKNISII